MYWLFFQGKLAEAKYLYQRTSTHPAYQARLVRSRNIPYQLRLTRMLLAVIGVFFITFTTYVVSSVLLLSGDDLLHNIHVQGAYNVGKILPCLNSLANPCIYVWKDRAIRRAHRKLLCWICIKSTRRTNRPTWDLYVRFGINCLTAK